MKKKVQEKNMKRMFGGHFSMQLFELNSLENLHSHIKTVQLFMQHLELKFEIF